MEAFDFAVGLGSVGAGAPWAGAGVFECLEEVVGAVAGSVVGEDSFAVIMNMLSIGAAYGVVVAVFQWGWLGDIIGIEPGPIEPFIPMMLFAVLFGLSMDYEVFLLSRMKEEFERTGDPVNSVADGLAATARVITAAALIMVFVFGSFVFEDQRAIKMFGLGLAAAVAVDASLVRMLIVPSTMELLGARNWWLPGWLDRILPNLNVEGSLELSETPDEA